jgi:hypothetical protein
MLASKERKNNFCNGIFSILSAVYEKFTCGEYDIFFSHAWKDKPYFSHIHQLLVKKGYLVWYDLNA